jgi:hypothetical protein
MYRRQQLKKLYPFVLLLIILLGSFSAFNAARGWDFSPFYQVRSYSKTFNTAPGSNTPASDMQVAYNALCRTPWLFAAYERQENQNIYFWCEKLPLLHLLPAPGLVIPAAAAAFLIMLSAGWWKKSRFWYILVPVLALALPLCVRDVIGRYRLMLVPYFIIAAIMGHYAYRTLTIRRKYLALLAGGIAAALSVYAGTSMPRTRSEDHHAWALALENTPGAKKDAILAAFEEYWTASGYRSEKAFRAFIDRLLHFGELPAAEALILQAYQNNISPDIAGYYHCWVYVLRNQPVQVERIAARINPDRLPPDLRKTFIRLRQDTRNILHNRQK